MKRPPIQSVIARLLQAAGLAVLLSTPLLAQPTISNLQASFANSSAPNLDQITAGTNVSGFQCTYQGNECFWLKINGSGFDSSTLTEVQWINTTTGFTKIYNFNNGGLNFIGPTQLRILPDQTMITDAANVTIRVVDQLGTVSAPFTINYPISAPSLPSLPPATTGVPYSQPLINGGTPPIDVFIALGATPPGMPSFPPDVGFLINGKLGAGAAFGRLGAQATAAGRLSPGTLLRAASPGGPGPFAGPGAPYDYSGTPTTPGTYNFQLHFLDPWFNSVYQDYSMTVAPPPTITNIAPTAVGAGTSTFTLTVNGTNFVTGTVVQMLAGTPPGTGTPVNLTTSIVNTTQVTATVAATQVIVPGAFTIRVVVPSGSTSNAVLFSVNAPAITSLSPTGRTAGNTTFTLTVNGGSFVTGGSGTSVVFWNATALTTTFVSTAQLTASVPAALFTAAGTPSITVVNPGANSSNAVQFPVRAAPAITTVTPNVRTAGNGPLTITVDGANFQNGDTVRFDATALSTTFVNATQLTATLPAAQLTAGAHNVTVQTSDVFTSNAVAFNVQAGRTISILSPTFHTAGFGGFTLTVTGTGFVNGDAVVWDAGPVSTGFVSSTSLTGIIPAGVVTQGNHTVRVQSTDGAFSNSLNFTVNGAPTVTSLNPTFGTVNTGFTITVNGTNFVSGVQVLWDGVTRTTTFVSATQVTAVIPAGAVTPAGAHPVAVQAADGVTSNNIDFVVNPAPVLTSLGPPTNRTVGSGQFGLTITGTNFVNGYTAQWDGTPLATTFNSPTQVTATVTAGLMTAGAHNVLLRTVDGVNSNTLVYQILSAPSITSLAPNFRTAGNGPVAIVITGTNFIAGDTALWDGADIGATFNSTTQLTTTVSAALLTAGGHTITVRTPDGVLTNASAVTVNGVPTVTSLNPASRTVGSAFTVTVNGTNFVAGVQVLWDGSPLTTTFVSATQVTAAVPAGVITPAGAHPVAVRTADGVVSNSLNVTVLAAPVLTSLGPPTNRTVGSGQFALTVNGSNFVNGYTIQWDGTPLATTFNSATQVTATVTAAVMTTGSHSVLLRTVDGIDSNPLLYQILPAPAISSLNPNFRTAGNGPVAIVITGTNFINGDTALWDGADIGATFNSATQMTTTVSAAQLTSGGHTITVRTPDGIVSNASAVTVNGVPAITSLNPSVRTAGNGPVTLTVTGANFVSGVSITWDGVAVTTNFVSATQLTTTLSAAMLTAPSHAVGVQTADGVKTSALTFTVNPAPLLTSLSPAERTAGNGPVVVTISGANFTSTGMTVLWDGSLPLTTTFVSATQLTATLSAGMLVTGTHTISTATADGFITNGLAFLVNGIPVLNPFTPNTRDIGTQSIALALSGSNFTGTMKGVWDGTPIPTTFNSANNLTVIVPFNLMTVGPHIITVVTSDGISSNPQTFNLTTPPTQPLSILSSLPQGEVNAFYSGLLTGKGGTSPYTFITAGGSLPGGLSLGSDGYITGKPTAPGHFTFLARVTDAASVSADQSLSIDVVAPPLSITTSSLPATPVGSPLNLSFAATGGVPPYTFSASGLPAGVQVQNNVLTGSPTKTGTFNIIVTVQDNAKTTASRSLDLLVTGDEFIITTSSLANGNVGAAYSASVAAGGGLAPYSFSATGLPAGLTMSAAGDITGTPGAEGTNSVVITASDSASGKATRTLALIVDPAKLAVISASLPNGNVGSLYSASIGATGGVKPYTFVFGGLPPGLTGAADGSISGTPSQTGDFALSVTVTDAKAATAIASPHIVVATSPLTLTASLPNGVVGTAYSGSVSATGGTAPLTYTITGLPAGLTAGADGTVTGTPTAVGTSNVSVTATDANSATATSSFTVIIALPPVPPVNITGAGGSANPGTQPNVGITVTNSFPLDMQVTLTLVFNPDFGPDDPSIQFITGGRTATLTVPAGRTVSLSTVGVQVGTVAGLITITAKLSTGGADVTPTPPPSTTIRINPSAPVLSGITATRTASGFTVVVTGYASSKEITAANVTFTAAPGANLQTTTLTIPVDALFTTWFASSASAPFGGQFTLTLPFNVQGDISGIASVTVSLASKAGTSAPLTASII